MKKVYLLVTLVSLGALIYSECLETARSESRARLQAIGSQLDTDIREVGNQSLLAVTTKLTERLTGKSGSAEWTNTLITRINSNLSELESGENWRIQPQFISTIVNVDGQPDSPVPQSITAAAARIKQALTQIGPDLDNLFNSVDTIDPSSVRDSVRNVTAVSDAIAGLTGDLQNKLKPGSVMAERGLSFISGGIALLSLGGLFWSALGDSRNTRLTVTRLLDETKELARGDLTVKAQVTGDITAPIANSINHAVSEMRRLVTGVRQAAGEVSQTASKTEERLARLKTHRVFQSGEISDCTDDATNLSDRIHGISQSAAASTPPVRECAKLARQGLNTTENTARVMDAARNQAQQTRNHLQRMVEGCLQIRDVVNSIRDTTEQTHTLSLNASLQAAGETETGPGFAGTAEEIRSLAEHSTQASNEITELVENLRQEAGHALACIQATNREVISGTAGADQVRRTLNEIETLNQPLPAIMDQLSDELENELKTVVKIGKRMEALQDSTARAWLDVSQIAVSLEKMKLAANRLEQSTEGFRMPESRSGNG